MDSQVSSSPQNAPYGAYDVCVRGGGLVGRTLALLLAQQQLRVALVAAPAPENALPDIRAYAFTPASRQLLAQLKCWPAPEKATPVQQMRIFGDGAGRSSFDASEHEHPALAWIVDVPAVEQMLEQACQFQSHIDTITPEQAQTLHTPLTVVCEGKHSATRQMLGVEYTAHPYPQTAIATRATLGATHAQTAWQWFGNNKGASDILALLPLGGSQGREVAVVWSVPHARATELMALDDTAFAAALQDAVQHQPNEAPPITAVARRAAWPLQQGLARRWVGTWPTEGKQAAQTRDARAARVWVLAGDAAHTVHPLAGQGMNLGLGDVALLAQRMAQRPSWRTPADRALLRSYERTRKAQIAPLMAGMDGLQWFFSHPATPVEHLRNWGMQAFERSGPLKRWIAAQAMG